MRPIIFSGPMVRAILEGRKTQTRRVAKLLLPGDADYINCASHDEWLERRRKQCPYGAPGDRLWVRETWSDSSGSNGTKLALYRATYPGPSGIYWRPSIHMPRWASRITLELTGVRLERVQEISEADAMSEGVEANYWADFGPDGEIRKGESWKYRAGFHETWDVINLKRGYGWDVNPWVWVLEFRRVGGAAA